MAGFKSEQVADFLLECMAGFVGIRNPADHSAHEVATAGFQGVATFTSDGKAERFPLAPAGDNRLAGTASAPLSAEFKGVVRITTPTGSTAQG